MMTTNNKEKIQPWFLKNTGKTTNWKQDCSVTPSRIFTRPSREIKNPFCCQIYLNLITNKMYLLRINKIMKQWNSRYKVIKRYNSKFIAKLALIKLFNFPNSLPYTNYWSLNRVVQFGALWSKSNKICRTTGVIKV